MANESEKNKAPAVTTPAASTTPEPEVAKTAPTPPVTSQTTDEVVISCAVFLDHNPQTDTDAAMLTALHGGDKFSLERWQAIAAGLGSRVVGG